ncbi:MAG: diaminopimelate epimerase [Fibrobacteria bacterium]|nr:diaminopimelate epimerase [Fibrobacteria bacterium]
MNFIKMHGTGNDYVYVDCFTETVVNPSELAVSISHRHFGVGSDGLILIFPHAEADAEMVMYNADGSMSEMCGNGLRCVAKFVHDNYAKGKKNLRLMTGRGILNTEIITGSDGLAELITVNMGAPIFNGLAIPTTIDLPKVFEQHLDVAGRSFTFHAVSMGNPHCVIYVDDVEHFPISEIGPLIEHHPVFPARVNVEFVEIVSEKNLIQRTWERGAGETWACGTGASAVAVVSRLTGKTEKDIKIRLLGGELSLSYEDGGDVIMTGPAVEVFRGEWA